MWPTGSKDTSACAGGRGEGKGESVLEENRVGGGGGEDGGETLWKEGDEG